MRVITAGSALSLLPQLSNASSLPQDGIPLDLSIVKEFVSKSHGNLDVVKAMVEEHPHIINACWDWGDGDFETGLGAAGHVGAKDVANFLIEKGARPDIFVLSMLGKTAIVKAVLEEYPDLIHSTGPHGFTLLHHAKKGGDDALELKDYFERKGLTKTKEQIYKR